MSEKWSLFKGKVLNKDILKKMPKIGPYLVLILSKSPFFQKSPCEKEILCHFFYLDNKISAQMHIQTGHCQFWGLFGFKLETTMVGLESAITLSCAFMPRKPLSLCGDTAWSLLSGYMVLIWYLFFRKVVLIWSLISTFLSKDQFFHHWYWFLCVGIPSLSWRWKRIWAGLKLMSGRGVLRYSSRALKILLLFSDPSGEMLLCNKRFMVLTPTSARPFDCA